MAWQASVSCTGFNGRLGLKFFHTQNMSVFMLLKGINSVHIIFTNNVNYKCLLYYKALYL